MAFVSTFKSVRQYSIIILSSSPDGIRQRSLVFMAPDGIPPCEISGSALHTDLPKHRHCVKRRIIGSRTRNTNPLERPNRTVYFPCSLHTIETLRSGTLVRVARDTNNARPRVSVTVPIRIRF
ncbi:hypothetical protein RRG08_050194 [Elysia crispata]|uniref:Uncharacterized protein n=1 Tax=Elysia crispata TaxID=231223 RepID=A0AAE1DBH3_9GAST|nr:hypothetical protein RRG08_050194 [Elysia crispata]